MNSIAERLRKLRADKGLSQTRVAAYLGISRTAYNKYESGAIKPVRKLKELSLLFGVSVDYLLEGKETDSDRERTQIAKYQTLSEPGKDIVDITLDAVYEREILAKERQSSDENQSNA